MSWGPEGLEPWGGSSLFSLVFAEVDINTGNEGMFIPKKYVLAEDGEIRKNRFLYVLLKKHDSLRFRV